MTSPGRRWLQACWSCFLAALSLFAAPAFCQRLEFAGVLGNSGVAGESLVRVNLDGLGRDGTRLNAGVYLDRDLRVWTSGGDAFNCLSFDGRLLRRYPLSPAGSRIDTPAFAALDGVLYACGHLPKSDPKTRYDVAIFALPMADGTEATVAMKIPEVPTPRASVLCAGTRNGRLLIAFSLEPDGATKEVAVEAIDPRSGDRARLFVLPGDYICSLALDPAGDALFIGGYFGKYIGASHHQPRTHEILKVTWDGTVLWRRECLETPANPTQFRGIASIAGGALWDAAWYGFLARFDREGKAAPGKVASWDMRIPYVSQVLDVRAVPALLPPAGPAEVQDPLLLANHSPEHTYLAVWNDDVRELQLRQRYGSLPKIASVDLSSDGWANVGTDGIQLWWRFDDAANAPPRFANHSAAGTPGAFRGEWLSRLTGSERVLPVVSRPALGRESAQPAHEQVAPFKDALGFAAVSAADGRSLAYATDNREKRIWRSTMDGRTWAPVKSWKPLTMDGGTVTAPGDLALLPDGSLVAVDGGALVRLEPAGADVLRVVARLEKWGDRPDQHFGAHLRLAGDGTRILVSDTDRHRVLLLDAARLAVLAQFGTIDAAGTETNQFASPGPVALAGNRALVADPGNQRVVKLSITDDHR